MKKRMIFTFVCSLLSLSLLLGLASPVAAAEPRWTPSASYRSSTYYTNLKSIPVTGDMAFDTVSVALSQIGYHEGSGSSQLGGNGTGSGNYTEYNLAFGKIGGSYAYAWCAAFVSWCLVQSGAKESAGGLFASCTLWVDELTEIGQYRTRSSGYEPRAGDLVFFRGSGTTRASDHVGLVRYVKGGRVYTVEGNSSDRVALRDYALTDTYIVGYGLPNYGATKSIDRLKAEDKATGIYAITYDFVNVRSSASASATKRGTLSHGKVVSVSEVKNGWGKIEYEGGVAYISLEYADFVAPHEYRVRYVSEGKELLTNKYYSIATLRVSTLSPEKENAEFLYWKNEKGDTFSSGDTLPVGDHTLSAVFRDLPLTLPQTPSEEDATPPPDMEDTGVGEVLGDGDVLLGVPLLPEGSESGGDRALAAQHAGVVSGVLSATIALAFLLFSKKREETE